MLSSEWPIIEPLTLYIRLWSRWMHCDSWVCIRDFTCFWFSSSFRPHTHTRDEITEKCLWVWARDVTNRHQLPPHMLHYTRLNVSIQCDYIARKIATSYTNAYIVYVWELRTVIQIYALQEYIMWAFFQYWLYDLFVSLCTYRVVSIELSYRTQNVCIVKASSRIMEVVHWDCPWRYIYRLVFIRNTIYICLYAI